MACLTSWVQRELLMRCIVCCVQLELALLFSADRGCTAASTGPAQTHPPQVPASLNHLVEFSGGLHPMLAWFTLRWLGSAHAGLMTGNYY
jgi:hypothetical protein